MKNAAIYLSVTIVQALLCNTSLAQTRQFREPNEDEFAVRVWIGSGINNPGFGIGDVNPPGGTDTYYLHCKETLDDIASLRDRGVHDFPVASAGKKVAIPYYHNHKIKLSFLQIQVCDPCLGWMKEVFEDDLAPVQEALKGKEINFGLTRGDLNPRDVTKGKQAFLVNSPREAPYGEGDAITIACTDIYPEFAHNVHNPFEDIKNLTLMQKLALAAYSSADAGGKAKGGIVTGTGMLGERSGLLPITKRIPRSYFVGIAAGKYDEVHEYEFVVEEVFENVNPLISREPDPFHPDPKYKGLGPIPRGFRAIILRERHCGLQVIAYAGTDDGPDVVDDILQGFPIGFDDTLGTNWESRVSPQYQFALKLARMVVRDEVKIPGLPVRQMPLEKYLVCGHSLGGGLATYVSCMLGIRGYGFNSAALASGAQVVRATGVDYPDLYVTQVRSQGDPVSFLTDVVLGTQFGDTYTVESATPELQTQHFLRFMNCEDVQWYKMPPSAETLRSNPQALRELIMRRMMDHFRKMQR